MESVIYKYELFPGQDQKLILPTGAQVLSVGNQKGVIALWAKCNLNMSSETRSFDVIGTGWVLDISNREFIGTVQIEQYVWHVFEVKL